MRTQFSKIVLAAFAAIATTAPQAQPQEQPQVQPQHQQPQLQCQCQCPPQKEYQYQYQYQYPPQQEQHLPQQRQVANMEQRRIVQRLIDNGFKENKYKIAIESADLSPYDIDALYEKNKMNAIGYAVLSGSVGLGIGSYMQGNMAFGGVQSLLDVFGTLSLLTGHPEVSAVILSISRITGLTSAFIYQYYYNKTLEDVLNGNSYSYSIDPLIVPKDGGAPAVGLAFNLRY